MATAADWVETVTGVTPPPTSVVSDYWAAMAGNGCGHRDIGLSVPQLWAWWSTHPIGGIKLLSATSLPGRVAGAQLAAGHPLVAIADLPADFGFDMALAGALPHVVHSAIVPISNMVANINVQAVADL